MSNIGHNGGPPLDCGRKILSIWLPISIGTLINHAWGAAERAKQLSDKELVKAWGYSHAAKVMQSSGITPKGYIHRRHHHIRPQIADDRRITILNEEMDRRGLLDFHEVDISVRR